MVAVPEPLQPLGEGRAGLLLLREPPEVPAGGAAEGRARVQPDGLAEGRLRLGVVMCEVGEQPEEVGRVLVGGIALQGLAGEGARLGGAPLLLQGPGAVEQLGRARGGGVGGGARRQERAGRRDRRLGRRGGLVGRAGRPGE